MSLLTGFNVTLPEVSFLAQAAIAAFAGGPVPTGWTIVTPAQLGLPTKYSDGPYYTDPDSGASAIVLQQGTKYVVAFRGTDGLVDVVHYPELLTKTYINHFQPLLSALSASAPAGSSFSFTGASLGGGATNLLAEIAGLQFGGRFATATFVAFASPVLTEASHVLNLGFENDPIFKALNGYSDFVSSTDNLVIATSEYMAGNYDGQHPFDDSAHDVALSFSALSGLTQSRFYPLMSPDSIVIVDANVGLVQDITPGREATGAFYLGQDISDLIAGRAGNDFIEGFGGDDTLLSGAGNDNLDGGLGGDYLFSGDFSPDGSFLPNSGADTLDGGDGNDGLWGADGNDHLLGGARSDGLVGGAGDDLLDGGDDTDLLFGGDFSVVDGSFVPNSGDDTLNGGNGNDGLWGFDGKDATNGDAGDDYVEGGLGDDSISGGADNDTLLGQAGADTVGGGSGFDYLYGGAEADVFVFDKGDSYDTIWDFSAAEGDKVSIDPALAGSFAEFQSRVSGFNLEGADFTVFLSADGLDQLTIKGIAHTAWTANLLT